MKSRERPDSSSIAALVSVQILFGLHYLAAKALVANVNPANWAFIRAFSSGVLLCLAVALARIPFPKDRPTILRLFGLSLFGVAINQFLFIEGIARSTPAHSALINTSIPVLVLLIAVILGRERPTAQRLLGIVATLGGVMILIGPQAMNGAGQVFQGDLMTLGNGLSYSLFLVLGKPVFERERALPATALILIFGSIWLAPIGIPGLGSLVAPGGPEIAPPAWMLAIFIVLGPTIGAYVLNTYALRRVESSIVAFFIYLQPLIGAGLSIGLGQESPTARLFIAAAVVFGGIFIALSAR